MRNEQTMLELIVNTAHDDERIRTVIMNGSRANPNAPRDPFQDFDIVYLVTDIAPFIHNLPWLERFGELMILQMPDEMQDPPPDNADGFTYLMQFIDGNRIDLGIYPLDHLAGICSDSLSVVLLDKDRLVPQLAPPNESDYFPTPPTAKNFADCCNEFWWVSPYVAKGLWRGEMLYAKHMLDVVVRAQLMKMLRWHIGVQTQWACNPGKYGKYFEKYLAPDVWQLLLQTYAPADDAQTWDALFTMCQLFRRITVPLAEHFGFAYPHADDTRVTAHLEHVRYLPKNAKEIY